MPLMEKKCNYTGSSFFAVVGVIVFVGVLMLSCTEESNPFADPTNAGVHIESWSLSDSDTIPVFSSGTMTILITARELVDSVVLSAPGNRYWSDTTLLPGLGGKLLPSSVDFSISFFDTGTQEVEVVSYVTNGTRPSRILKTYCRSPLKSDTIMVDYGKELELSANSVPDEDVMYFWDFGGAGRRFQSSKPGRSALLLHGPAEGTGYVWVSDVKDTTACSPKTPFFYSLSDVTAPDIAILNNSSDTIVTGASELALSARITDRGEISVEAAEIDGEPFDYRDAHSNTYVKIFRGMDTLSGVKKTVLWAMDNRRFRNEARKTVYLRYDPSEKPGSEVRLQVKVPANDTTIASNPFVYVSGNMYAPLRDTTILNIQVNDSLYDEVRRIGGAQGFWNWKVYLPEKGANLITVSAKNAAEDSVLAAEMVVVKYDPSAIDEKPPVILQVGVDGKPADGLYIDAERVRVEVIAFDEGSTIETFKMNNLPAEPSLEKHTKGYVWYRNIDLEHTAEGNEVAIEVTDKNGNTADTLVTIYRNGRPSLVNPPEIPSVLVLDTTYVFPFGVYDPDGDKVTAEVKHAPVGLEIVDRSIRWSPGKPMLDSVVLEFWDGFQLSSRYVGPLQVYDRDEKPRSVSFAVSSSSIPSVVEVGKTVRIPVHVDTTSGQPPFTFKFQLDGHSIPVTETNDSLTWIPSVSDTGSRVVKVTVTDLVLSADTILKTVFVVPTANSPCSLAVLTDLPRLEDEVVDMRSVTEPADIVMKIIDKDHHLADRHSITIVQGNASIGNSLDSARQITITLSPKPSLRRDTLVVAAEDKTGNKDTVTLHIAYAFKSPADMAQLAGWFGTGGGIVLTQENSVEQWFSSDSSVLLSQPSAAKMPSLLKHGGPNGNPALRFDNSQNSHLYHLGYGNWAGDEFTVSMVVRINQPVDSQQALLSVGADDGFALGIDCDGEIAILNEESRGFWADTNHDSSGLPLTPAKWSIVTWRSESGVVGDDIAVNAWLNGTAGQNTMKLHDVVEGDSFVIGAGQLNNPLGPYFRGDIAEIIFFNRALTDKERLNVEMLLSEEFAIELSGR